MAKEISLGEPQRGAEHYKDYCVVAMKRSGHHAFIEWLLSGLKEKYIFLCNLNYKDNIQRQVIVEKLQKNLSYKTNIESINSGIFFESLNRNDFTLIHNHEDALSEDYLYTNLIHPLNNKVIYRRNQRKIVFVRDPINLFASVLKRYDKRIEFVELNYQTLTSIWMDHAKFFLDNKRDDVVAVSYNMWVSSECYRSEISKLLDMENAPIPREMSQWGGGSSFSGYAKGQIHNFNLNRWEEFKNDEMFLSFFYGEDFFDAAKKYLMKVDGDNELVDALEALHKKANNIRNKDAILKIRDNKWNDAASALVDNKRVQAQAAKDSYSGKNYASSIEKINKSIKIDKNCAYYYFFKSIIFSKMGDYLEAENDVKKALSLTGSSYEFKFHHSNILRKRGFVKEAFSIVDALKNDGKVISSGHLYVYAITARDANEHNKAENAFLELVYMRPYDNKCKEEYFIFLLYSKGLIAAIKGIIVLPDDISINNYFFYIINIFFLYMKMKLSMMKSLFISSVTPQTHQK